MKYRNSLEAARFGRTFDPQPAEFPVDFKPGSIEKQAMMSLRASLGQEVFHQQDRADFLPSSSNIILGPSAGDNPVFFRKDFRCY